MMNYTAHAIAGGVLTLSTLACPTPTEPTLPDPLAAPTTTVFVETRPPCTLDVVLLDHIYDNTTCDVSPPQILAAYLDGGDGDMLACDHSGGRVLHTKNNDFICINIDY
jgi:hypothetical protein